MKILLVEDNEANSDMLSRRLARRGYEVIVAADGGEGIARAFSDAPDLILLDVSLPEPGGWDTARRLKADPRTRATPIIALTPFGMPGERDEAFAAGCSEYEIEPIEFDRLLHKIRTLLGERVADGG